MRQPTHARFDTRTGMQAFFCVAYPNGPRLMYCERHWKFETLDNFSSLIRWCGGHVDSDAVAQAAADEGEIRAPPHLRPRRPWLQRHSPAIPLPTAIKPWSSRGRTRRHSYVPTSRSGCRSGLRS